MTLLALVAAVLVAFYTERFYRVLTRSRKGPYARLRQPRARSLLFGNLAELYSCDLGVVAGRWIREYGGIVPFTTLFGRQQLLVTDPMALQHILVTQCYDYVKPDEVSARIKRTLGSGLVFSEGDVHRRARKIMSPSFSSAEATSALPTIFQVAHRLRDIIDDLVTSKTVELEARGPEGSQGGEKQSETLEGKGQEERALVDIHGWLGRATLDIVGQIGFGYDFQGLSQATNSLREAFHLIGNSAAIKLSPGLVVAQQVVHWTLANVPFASRLPLKKVKDVKQCLVTIEDECEKVYAERKSALESMEQLETTGRDFITLLLKANMSSEEKRTLSDEEVKGQMSTMVLAGGETSSTLLSWCLFHLSKNPTIQTKLRTEIQQAFRAAKDGGGAATLSGNELGEMQYLDAVIRETLRLEPPVASMYRSALHDDVLPLSEPLILANGSELSSLPITAGTNFHLDILNFNRRSSAWGPKADDFFPERWMMADGHEAKGEDEKKKQAVPGAWAGLMSFSVGPRACIGFKFALLEIKAILSVLLDRFEFYERDGGMEVQRGGAIIMRPFLKGEEKRGVKLPMVVKFASAE